MESYCFLVEVNARQIGEFCHRYWITKQLMDVDRKMMQGTLFTGEWKSHKVSDEKAACFLEEWRRTHFSIFLTPCLPLVMHCHKIQPTALLMTSHTLAFLTVRTISNIRNSYQQWKPTVSWNIVELMGTITKNVIYYKEYCIQRIWQKQDR